MMHPGALLALWLSLVLIATLFAICIKVSSALWEVVVPSLAQQVIGVEFDSGRLLGEIPRITFLVGKGAVVAEKT